MGKRVRGKDGKARAAKRITEQPGITAPSSRYLVWRFGRLDHESEFGCQNLVSIDARELELELASLQKHSISSLLDKRWLKFIPAGDMTPDGQTALTDVNEQEEGLWQLHLLRHKWRVWGYFEEPDFFFLWWDPNHAVATGKSRSRKS